MEAEDLEAASTFCQLVQSADLFEYLGVASDAKPEVLTEALNQQRRRMQSMQHNPKYADAARVLLRNFRRLERVLEEPQAHLADMRRIREDEHIPMLHLALQSVMADGRISMGEEAFLRQASLQLGISRERYEQELHAQVAEKGVLLELSPEANPQDSIADGIPSPEALRTARLRGADGHGWWDASFTRLLLECIPGGPGSLIDVYCRTGLSASTILPERPQISWTGIDRSLNRLAEAREILSQQGAGTLSRVVLREGAADDLPIDNECMDYVLVIRALPNLHDTRPVIEEAARVLRPGGRIIVVEPDGLAETFYFRGPLQAYNEAFHALCVEVDQRLGTDVPALGRPGIAIGPTLPERLSAQGFTPGTVRVHASHNLKVRPLSRLSRQLRRYPTALAERVELTSSPLLKRVLNEVDSLERQFAAGEAGIGGHVLPLFVAVGDRPVA